MIKIYNTWECITEYTGKFVALMHFKENHQTIYTQFLDSISVRFSEQDNGEILVYNE